MLGHRTGCLSGVLRGFHHCDPLKTSSALVLNPGTNTLPTPGPQRTCTTSLPENLRQADSYTQGLLLLFLKKGFFYKNESQKRKVGLKGQNRMYMVKSGHRDLLIDRPMPQCKDS